MAYWFQNITANQALAVQRPELFSIACVADFAYQAARSWRGVLDPEEMAQVAAERMWPKVRAGKQFRHDGQTRNYVKLCVSWEALNRLRKGKLEQRWAQEHGWQMSELERTSAGVVERQFGPAVERVLQGLRPDERTLLLSVVIDDVPVTALAETQARLRAIECVLDWEALAPREQKELVGTAYNTLKRRLSRLNARLQEQLA